MKSSELFQVICKLSKINLRVIENCIQLVLDNTKSLHIINKHAHKEDKIIIFSAIIAT